MRIVLVGFMAAGKTTIGRLLARRLDWEFVDFDERIARMAGRPVGAVIREEGEAAFRRLESALTDELAGRSRVVLAPGGGWGADPERAGRLGPGTVRVWLRVSAEEAVRRAEADERAGVDRPLLDVPGARAAAGVDSPGDGRDLRTARTERARALLAHRRVGYATAEVVVDVDGREPDVVVQEILRRLDTEVGGA